nr:reverse transcriptase domain-containing protein [Tanacetum cinerariifolium]
LSKVPAASLSVSAVGIVVPAASYKMGLTAETIPAAEQGKRTDQQASMNRFKRESSHIKGVPLVLRIPAFMKGHGHLELVKKLNDKILKMMDEMFKRVRAFIRGEVTAVSEGSQGPAVGQREHPYGMVERRTTQEFPLLPPPGVDRPKANHGRAKKEQNHTVGVRHSEMPLSLQCHHGKDEDEEPQSDIGNAQFMERNVMVSAHGADVKDKRAGYIAKPKHSQPKA